MLKTLIEKSGYSFQLTESLGEFYKEWDSIQPSSLLLNSDYLLAIEKFRPGNIHFKYALVYDTQGLAAAFYFQLLPFNAAQRLKLLDKPKKSLSKCFYDHVKRLVASQVDFVTLVNGNLLATGPYGFKYRQNLDLLDIQQMLDQLLKALFDEPELIHRASVCLIKELPIKHSFTSSPELPLNFMHPFLVQPSMWIQVRPDWVNFDHYLNDLQSKYRLRLRKAMEASASLIHREMEFSEVQEHEQKIFELYKKTADQSDFNLVDLHPNYFSGLKSMLGNKFRVFGFFKDGELVAFYTFLDDGNDLVGHFLGASTDINTKYQLYLNMLIHYIRHGIHGRFQRILLARTAIEIKSSVGAEPEEMMCFIAHRNKIYNRWVPNLLEFLKPRKPYILRTPFKEFVTAADSR